MEMDKIQPAVEMQIQHYTPIDLTHFFQDLSRAETETELVRYCEKILSHLSKEEENKVKIDSNLKMNPKATF